MSRGGVRYHEGARWETGHLIQEGLEMRFVDLSDLEVVEETALQSVTPAWGGFFCAGTVCGLICIGL